MTPRPGAWLRVISTSRGDSPAAGCSAMPATVNSVSSASRPPISTMGDVRPPPSKVPARLVPPPEGRAGARPDAELDVLEVGPRVGVAHGQRELRPELGPDQPHPNLVDGFAVHGLEVAG